MSSVAPSSTGILRRLGHHLASICMLARSLLAIVMIGTGERRKA